jgi:hypothetical protein
LVRSPIFVKKAPLIIPRNYKTAFLFSSREPNSSGYKRREALTLLFNDIYTKLQDAEKFPGYQEGVYYPWLKTAFDKWKRAEAARPGQEADVFSEHCHDIVWSLVSLTKDRYRPSKVSLSKMRAGLDLTNRELFSECTKESWAFISKYVNYSERLMEHISDANCKVIKGYKLLQTLEHFAQSDEESVPPAR